MDTFSYTGSQLATQVEEKFGDSGNVQITRTMQLGWINNGIRAIVAQNPFLEKVATTNLLAGQTTYDLATLFAAARIRTITLITVRGQALATVPFPEFQGLISDNQSIGAIPPIGTPTVGTIFGNTLTIWPVPDTTVSNGITLYFKANPADLTAITDPLTIPDRLYNVLFDYVMAQALELDENFTDSQIKLNHYQDGMRREYEKEHQSPDAFYSGITADPYDDDAVYWPGSF